MTYDATKDPFSGHAATRMSPSRSLVAITPDDANQLTTYVKALRIWVGTDVTLTNGAATVRVVPAGAAVDTDTVDLKVPQGVTIEPTSVRKVLVTGTTSGVVIHGYVG